MHDLRDAIIVGAGPAGMTAAIQLARYGMSVYHFERNQPGGLLRNANLVENYPGHASGVSGSGLVGAFVSHMDTWGCSIIREEVLSLSHEKEIYTAKTENGTYTARTAVIASGTIPVVPGDIEIAAEARKRAR